MMSRICLAVLALALGAASECLAVDHAKFNFQPHPDQFTAPPAPGMRFTGAELASVRTAGGEGGYIYSSGYGAGYGNCNCGGAGGYCADWTLLPWYGSWDEHPRRGGCYVRKPCSTCNY